MPKIGHQYIDTPMAFSEVPSGVKFMSDGMLYVKLWPEDKNEASLRDGSKFILPSDLQVLAWMPKALLAQRAKELTPEWQRKHAEAQERVRNGWRGCPEEGELVIDGEKRRGIEFIPVR